MNGNVIDYRKIVDKAMQCVVREALEYIAKMKSCNILLTFSTKNYNTIIPEDLKSQYPEKMTIVLNNQFSNLKVSNQGFSVCLTFGGVQKKLSINFASIIYFCDRDSNFSIEFKNYDNVPDMSTSDLNPPEIHPIKDGKIIYFDKFIKNNKDDIQDLDD